MISCSILIALCILGGFHVYLVLSNQTTIEFQTNLMKRREARKSGEYYRNPYDLGRTRNFQSVFGPNPFCKFRWCLSWLALPPAGDGLSYASLNARFS
jgi:palmitoyltransferase